MSRNHYFLTIALAGLMLALAATRGSAQDAKFSGKPEMARVLLRGTRTEIPGKIMLCSLSNAGVRCFLGKEITPKTFSAHQVQSVSTAKGMYTYNPRTGGFSFQTHEKIKERIAKIKEQEAEDKRLSKVRPTVAYGQINLERRMELRAAALEAYRQELYRRQVEQRRLYEQQMARMVAARRAREARISSGGESAGIAPAREEVVQKAVLKIIGASIAHCSARDARNKDDGALQYALSLMVRDGLIEGAVKDLFAGSDAPDALVRAVSRTIILYFDGELKFGTLVGTSIRDEIKEAILRQNPKLEVPSQALEFLVLVIQHQTKGR